MAQNDIISVPGAQAGNVLTSTAAAWGTPSYSELTTGLASTIYIIGISFHTTYIPPVDTTIQCMIEIGTGSAGAEVVDIQIPYSYRMDTAVGYYLIRPYTIFLPEPVEVASGTRIAIRIYDSVASALTYQGVKVWYKEGLTLGGGFDPFGSMGIFGL